uniref:Uncharacterized protein n=1 Tax=Anguilla anguilla TaxID=7936 RepID=A0A0E9WIR9_ANGAN
MGLRSGLCAGQSKFSLTDFGKTISYGPRCVPGGIAKTKQEKGLPQNVGQAQTRLECDCLL